MKLLTHITGLLVLSACAFVHSASAATQYLSLGGPATGYLAISNYKNSTDQAGIEGTGNGLPDYPNYEIPTGQANAGRWTAIITATPSSTADYSPLYNGVSGVTVNNLVIDDPNYSTLSAGLISYDDSSLTGIGTETISVAALTFNFDIYQWDGYTANGWNTGVGTINISPFSTVQTVYNDGGGAGNAAGFYNLSLANVTGTGLTFQDGELISMDIDADLSVLMRIGNFPGAGSATFTGSFSVDGFDYAFDLNDTRSVAVFSGIHMVMNRAGTVSSVPEPSTFVLGGLGLAALLYRRRLKK